MAKQKDDGITWTDETCSPVIGCSPVGPECMNCWAVITANRLAGNPNLKIKKDYSGLTRKSETGKPEWTGIVHCLPDRLIALLRSRGTGRLFIPSMGDPFHDDVDDEFLDMLFAVAALCHKRIFQILTKRPKRARKYFSDPLRWALVEGMAQKLYSELHPEDKSVDLWLAISDVPNNVELILSAGTQKTLEKRIDDFLACPARIHGLSIEPMLEGMSLFEWIGPFGPPGSLQQPQALDWIIVGPETGPNRRFCDIGYIRSIVQQCRAANVRVHVKAIEIAGRISKDMQEWPEDLRMREFPEAKA